MPPLEVAGHKAFLYARQHLTYIPVFCAKEFGWVDLGHSQSDLANVVVS